MGDVNKAYGQRLEYLVVKLLDAVVYIGCKEGVLALNAQLSLQLKQRRARLNLNNR